MDFLWAAVENMNACYQQFIVIIVISYLICCGGFRKTLHEYDMIFSTINHWPHLYGRAGCSSSYGSLRNGACCTFISAPLEGSGSDYSHKEINTKIHQYDRCLQGDRLASASSAWSMTLRLRTSSETSRAFKTAVFVCTSYTRIVLVP